MHPTLRRGVAATAALSALTGALVAMSATPAAASDAGPLAAITSPNGGAAGTNLDYVRLTAPAPCNASATRHVAKIISVVPTNPGQQALADAWAGDNLYAPVGVGLPGPLTVEGANTFQGMADANGQQIVPGKWNLELRCQNNLGTSIYEQWKGSITFSSPTAWTVDAVAKVATTTGVAVTPQPVTAGQPITYTATVDEADAAAPTGSVEFKVDGGAVQTVAVGSAGTAVLTGVAPSAGTHSVVATYLGDAKFAGSTGSTSFSTAAAPASATSTSLVVTPVSGPAYQSVSLTGTVSATSSVVPTGVCDVFDGATKLATVPVNASGTCSYSAATFAAGAHTFKVVFKPSDAALFLGSTSADVSATYEQPAAAPDEQTVVVTVPAGNLAIFTPYTPDNPLDLGDMVLAANGSSYSASAAFDKVTITDTRAGNPGWTASLTRTDFVGSTGSIAASHSGFENVVPVYVPGNAVQSITVTDVPANDPAFVVGPTPFATAAAGQGTGTVGVKADFVLEGVPTSTKAGDYTATVVFTVG